jgi:hypothetical protein
MGKDMRGQRPLGYVYEILGALDSGAKNSHGILELGSQTGSIPSW